MKPRLKRSLVILAIFLALALPGAYGVNFVGNDNGGSYTASVSAATGGAVSLTSIGSANPHFSGGAAKKVQFSKRWTTGGNTFSEVGFLLRNTQSYDVTITGSKNNALKTTNAQLSLQATADYIKAWGDSGTARLYKAGVDLTVDHGSADIIVTTNADYLIKATHAQLDTNSNVGHDDAITGSDIHGHAYYTGAGTTKSSFGDVRTYVQDGSLTGYGLLANSAALGSSAVQTVGSAIGDYLRFTGDATKHLSGKNKEARTSTEITNGYVNNYLRGVIDTPLHLVAIQIFYEAGTTGNNLQLPCPPISIKNIYTESSKSSKIQAEQDAAVSGPGTIKSYISVIQDPSVVQLVNDAVAGNPGNDANVDLKGYYKQIDGSKSRQMWSETSVTDGELVGFVGLSSDRVYTGPTEFGTLQFFNSAQGSGIFFDNRYVDNKKGYGQVTVRAQDPAALANNGALTGKMISMVGSATSDGTVKDVHTLGYLQPVGLTAGLNVQVHSVQYYNQFADYSILASDPAWFDTILGDADPVAVIGHTVTDNTGDAAGGDSIQNALNTMPINNGNIFLEDAIYTGHSNKDIVNNANTVVQGAEVGFTLWGAGSYIKGASNSVIDNEAAAGSRIFDLTSDHAAQTFNFKNIDFNNGKATGNGGAIFIEDPPVHSSTVNIDYSNFNSNTAVAGGAIYNNGQTLNLNNCNFASNTATGSGGAIFNMASTTTVTGGSFTANSAGVSGGAIENSAGTLRTTGVTFGNNHAVTQGGAVCNDFHVAGATYTSSGDTFQGNHADVRGGAIYLKRGDTVTVTNGAFNNNYAGTMPIPASLGGAVLIDTTTGTGTASYSDPGTTYGTGVYANLPNSVQTI